VGRAGQDVGGQAERFAVPGNGTFRAARVVVAGDDPRVLGGGAELRGRHQRRSERRDLRVLFDETGRRQSDEEDPVDGDRHGGAGHGMQPQQAGQAVADDGDARSARHAKSGAQLGQPPVQIRVVRVGQWGIVNLVPQT
jgi:hypothetical protein